MFFPPGLRKFKLTLFERIAERIKDAGGSVIKHDFDAVASLPDHIVPVIGGSPELREAFTGWRQRGRKFITWDRGYARRVFATWLPRGENGGYYRWTISAWQMKALRDVTGDRWDALRTPLMPWRTKGDHIVVAKPSPTYERVHGIPNWTKLTIQQLKAITKRPILVRDKESRTPLQDDLKDAHCLVTHGSIAAVESVILGTPVFVHPDSAASLVGLTDLTHIERPIYPDRKQWVWSLAYSQYSERELVNGTLWKFIE